MLNLQQVVIDLQHCFELLKVYPHITSLCIDLEIAAAFLKVLYPDKKISENILQEALDYFVEKEILTEARGCEPYSIVETKVINKRVVLK